MPPSAKYHRHQQRQQFQEQIEKYNSNKYYLATNYLKKEGDDDNERKHCYIYAMHL